eukprot:CAMPEP_0206475816 /NCGR_PEP_ID=MMETSP0324_2-20121206/34321_1 /ASSEMBLY_ACC=CAM_ASM_000836 /TAXON_ID=2866 /ORGANISM="Crypthecodinium cohnii, Strain Seligo" /LENGTH=61 /DNA_ID=CAMNT_0053951279 /DNA_START=974 /DNA_END=1159 /DNA_ORIENTATION=+
MPWQQVALSASLHVWDAQVAAAPRFKVPVGHWNASQAMFLSQQECTSTSGSHWVPLQRRFR